jgi:hypothetical protein
MLERLLLGDASEDELRALLGRRGTLPATTPKKDGKP